MRQHVRNTLTAKAIIPLILVLLSGLLFAGGLKSHENQAQSLIQGTYSGTLFASGYDMPVVTTFYIMNGVIRGEYVMDENGTMTPGQLTHITFSGRSTIECTWEDKYGAGPASFTFADDYSGFTGWWGVENGEDMYNWWGDREPDDIQQQVRD